MAKKIKGLSVIIPVFNEAVSLQQNMVQLQALQSYCTVIFCDGGSDDATCALLQQHALPYCRSSRGRAQQMNAGAGLCNSDVLMFVHADTIIDMSHIMAVQEAMQDQCMVGGRFDVQLSGSHPAFRIIAYMINLRSRITGISTGDQCQFVRRSVFEEMGGFPRQKLMEDIEFSKRLKQFGMIANLKQTVITSSRRWQQHGIVKTVVLMWRLRFLYWLGTPPEKLSEMYRHVRE